MVEFEPEEHLPALTEPQRLVLKSLVYGDDVATIKEIRKIAKDKVSARTIIRALAKLCALGLVERVPAEKKGRGYSNLYRLMED